MLFIIATYADFTYQQSASINKSGKSTIDLTLTRGLANVKITTKDFDLINTRHKAVEIYIPEASQNKQTPKFRTKNAVWKDWEKTLEPKLLEYFNSFPNEISHEILDQQVEILTMLIQTSATDFFGLTEASNKKSKGWWNSDIKAARKKVKESVKQHRIRQSPANLEKMEKAKKEYKSLITESKLKQQNSDSNFLNNSRDSGQFWHRYNKIIGRKSNNIVKPIFDKDSQTYIFDDEIISEKLTNYHIRKTVNNDLKSSDFKAEIEKKINEIMKSNKLSETVVFFGKQHVKQAIKSSNINSAPGPDRITLDLIENGGDLLALCLTHLMLACYFVGYHPRQWKMQNRIYLKKSDKEHYYEENSYRPISLRKNF